MCLSVGSAAAPPAGVSSVADDGGAGDTNVWTFDKNIDLASYSDGQSLTGGDPLTGLKCFVTGVFATPTHMYKAGLAARQVKLKFSGAIDQGANPNYQTAAPFTSIAFAGGAVCAAGQSGSVVFN